MTEGCGVLACDDSVTEPNNNGPWHEENDSATQFWPFDWHARVSIINSQISYQNQNGQRTFWMMCFGCGQRAGFKSREIEIEGL